MKKSRSMYVAILIIWVLTLFPLIALIVLNAIKAVQEFETWKSILIILLVATSNLSLAYFWLCSIKDFMYSFMYVSQKKRLLSRYDSIFNHELTKEELNKKVLLLYCTCNDFNSRALEASMNQDFDNYETIILDDSKDQKYITEINQFAYNHDVKVIRREDKRGFKAGNINNYLQKVRKEDYDYIVILDSDEIIPSNFIKESLKYFSHSKKVGVIQAAHYATVSTNVYQDLLGMSIDSTSETAQISKNFYGANALIGHGMIISKECYVKTGGFPYVVAEDISFAIALKKAGFDIIYAPNIKCYEEFPNDYIFTKKRQCKWTQGNVEYMKKYSKDINKTPMAWYERLDLKLNYYSLPTIPILSFLIVLSSILLGFLGYKDSIGGSILMVLSVIFLCSNLLPVVFTYGKTKYWWKIIPYYLLSFVSYAAMGPMMIITIILGAFGKKAKFIVTPKGERKISLFNAFINSLDAIIFGTLVAVTTYFAYGNIMPTLVLSLACWLAPVAILIANIELHKKKTLQVEEEEKSQEIEFLNLRKEP